MQSFEPSGEARILRDERCSAHLWFPAPGMVCASITGHVTGAVTRAAYEVVDGWTAQHGFPGVGFVDLWALTGFDTDARTTMLRWNARHRAPANEMHVRVGSPLARLGVRVLSLAFREMVRAYGDEASFAAAYATALLGCAARSA